MIRRKGAAGQSDKHLSPAQGFAGANRYNKTMRILLLVMILTRLSVAQAPPEPPVLTVGDLKITRAGFEAFLNSLPDRVRLQYTSTPEARKGFALQFAEILALSQEARKRKLDLDEKTATQIRFQTDQLLANALVQHLMSSAPVEEANLKQYYEEHKSEYQQVVARHILIRFQGSPVPLKPNQKDLTEQEALAKAQDLKKRLTAGEDFSKLAREESDDAGSGAAGGSLGAFGRGQMVKPFDEAAFSQPVGVLGEPVKSQFGWHLIEVREQKNKSFEEVRTLIEQRRRPETARQIADLIKAKASIKLDEAYFGK